MAENTQNESEAQEQAEKQEKAQAKKTARAREVQRKNLEEIVSTAAENRAASSPGAAQAQGALDAQAHLDNAREVIEERQANFEDARQHVYDVADAASSLDMPVGPEGAPLTQFEMESAAFFEEQNKLEEQIDNIEVDRDARMLFAGTEPNALQSAGGDALPMGSATVTTYVGQTVHPYPPTDYAHAAIVSGDLTNNPEFALFGLVATDPYPPENSFEDQRETDARVDAKDFSRVLRLPKDAIVESRRTKYPSTEAPV